MLTRVRSLVARLGLARALGFLVGKVALRGTARDARLSWSQFGEDLVARDILGLEAGYYIDVGCNHPIRWSNTYLFYLHDWRGLLVDANAELIEKCKRLRPLDTSVCCLISDREGSGEIEIYDEHALSSGLPDHNTDRKAKAKLLERRTVATQTLTQLLDADGAPSQPDLLSIDVEGMDMHVLRGLDLSRYKPKLMIVEDGFFTPEDPSRSEVYRHLTGHGYRLYSYIHPSLFFLAPGVESKGFHGPG